MREISHLTSAHEVPRRQVLTLAPPGQPSSCAGAKPSPPTTLPVLAWPTASTCCASLFTSRRPDLHTHVAVANKVQTTDGRWPSIDGRVLYKAVVAASETYNTALEQLPSPTRWVCVSRSSHP
ncbi:MAG: relaxase domain-containing protein [Dermatophilaceae bacterium]